MMNRPLLIFTGILAMTLAVFAAEEPSGDAAAEDRSAPKLAWIGLDVGKLEQATRLHAGSVPEGVGFLVTSISPEGPAEKAGIRSYDILWKFEDQLLINEAQLGTLLRLRKPGDRVGLGIVRGGEHQVVEVELGTLPLHQVKPRIPASEIPLYPTGVPGLPGRIIYPQKRTAEISREDGSLARLRYEGEEAMVLILDAEGKEIYNGPLRKDGVFVVPEEWRGSVGALVRTLWKASDDDWKPRRPRPRVVSPPQTSSAE